MASILDELLGGHISQQEIEEAMKGHRLFYIRVENAPSPDPLIDAHTRKMAGLLNVARETSQSHGWFTCQCGAISTSADYILPGGFITNSLCVHYLAYHRSEIPREEMNKFSQIPNSHSATPTLEQLHHPPTHRHHQTSLAKPL